MSNLTPLEKRRFEDLFGMSLGNVLDYSNSSFAQYFADTVGIDIYSDEYSTNGPSKANRLRRFWEIEADDLVGKVLSGLLDMWKYINDKKEKSEENRGYQECRNIVARLMGDSSADGVSESGFLKQDFGTINFNKLNIDSTIIPVLESRYQEICVASTISQPLSIIILCGSILEGLLLAMASRNPQKFNQSQSSPKDDQGKVKSFSEWYLANFIDVGHEIGYLGLDVKKFSHVLREFRNYIHPYRQLSSGFNPDEHTAIICVQVLKAAIADLIKIN